MSNLILQNQVTSFTQDQKHETKSNKFIAIQPSQIGAALIGQGFDLVHLKMGKARKAGNETHQTTIARYRQNHELKIGGNYMDLVFKVPHLYGAIEAFVGTYRLVCSNGMVVGTKFFAPPRIKHVGDAQSQIDALIPQLVAKHDELVANIEFLQSRDVTSSQVAEFVRVSANLRLQGTGNVSNIQYSDLTRVRRADDAGNDAFTVLNVVQENLMRYGMRYETRSIDDTGRETVRNMTARPVTRSRMGDTESVRSVDLNASLWDAANEILMGGQKAA